MVRVKNLPDLTGTNIFPQPFLSCGECGAEYSANSGDYFNYPHEYVFMCCSEPMVLMTKRVVYEEWEPKKTTPEPKELHKGDRVQVRQFGTTPPRVGEGLTYPSFSGVLLEDAGTSEGWDVSVCTLMLIQVSRGMRSHVGIYRGIGARLFQ
jgi:hypothetical protein